MTRNLPAAAVVVDAAAVVAAAVVVVAAAADAAAVAAVAVVVADAADDDEVLAVAEEQNWKTWRQNQTLSLPCARTLEAEQEQQKPLQGPRHRCNQTSRRNISAHVKMP
jgi:hypothetical protein